jgi:putative aldouronate transport system substrate-binding protein
MKKFVSLLMGTLLASIIIILSGCSQRNTGQAAQSQQGQVVVTPGNPSWSQDKTPYTLSWFIAYDWFGETWNPNVNQGNRKLLEETGITLEYITGNTEKLNLLIATNDLPDIVTFDAIATQRKMLEDGGVLLDLDELSARYAPDLNVPQSMKDWYRASDGKWYGLASFYYGPERTTPEFGGAYATHNLNYARIDILDQIGMTLDDMKTKDGFLRALREVKNRNIRYNGRPMLPLIGGYPIAYAAQFGADLEDRNGKLLNIRRQPEYLEALLFMNTMFNEGLITDEQFTMSDQQRDQRVSSGEVFAATGWMTVQLPRRALWSNDQNAKMMYIGPINGGDSGKKPFLEGVATAGWTATMITKNARNPAKAIQFMAYMTSEEESIAAYYGTNAFDIINGAIVQKPEVVQAFADNYQAARARYIMDIQFFVDWTIIQRYTRPAPDAAWYDIDHYNQEHDTSVIIYDNKAFVWVIPDEGTDLDVTRVRIDDFWAQQEPIIIMARNADEVRRLYQEAITQADAIGMRTLDEFQDQMFQGHKRRLGVAFAWPRNQ